MNQETQLAKHATVMKLKKNIENMCEQENALVVDVFYTLMFMLIELGRNEIISKEDIIEHLRRVWDRLEKEIKNDQSQ